MNLLQDKLSQMVDVIQSDVALQPRVYLDATNIFQKVACPGWNAYRDFSIVGTCDMVTKSCDSPDWSIQSSLHSASSRVIETASMIWSCAERFPKRFNEENLIICYTNHCYGLTIKGDLMSTQTDYL